MSGYVLQLRNAIKKATPSLKNIGDEASRQPPRPGKWSPVEVIGHLIDSASNNHQRFVRAAEQNDLVFVGYAQDDWVERQRYQDAPWQELVLLWQLYNRQLARVMAATPRAVRERVHERHNLHRVAFR